jgi:hypothetical protein
LLAGATHAARGFENMPTRKRPSQRNYSGFVDEIASQRGRLDHVAVQSVRWRRIV